jgi:hypothetical protein
MEELFGRARGHGRRESREYARQSRLKAVANPNDAGLQDEVDKFEKQSSKWNCPSTVRLHDEVRHGYSCPRCELVHYCGKGRQSVTDRTCQKSPAESAAELKKENRYRAMDSDHGMF